MIKKKWQYLFWIGPCLLVMGLTAGVVSGIWGQVPLGLIILGFACTAAWLFTSARKNKWWERRSTQAGTNALIATISVVVILGLINFLASRYLVRIDLTETKLFTLAPQSQQQVQKLQYPVKVWLFERGQNPLDIDLLENYRRQSKLFSFEYVDPQLRPGLAEKFGVKGPGEVYVEAKNQHKLVQVLNESERLSELRLTNSLQRITSSNISKVYMLQGHGENALQPGQGSISQALNALGDKNFTPLPLNLAQSSVPADAVVVVVAGPRRELFPTEVKALKDYLDRGGNLLLMIDPNTEPKLDLLLNDWGVKLDNRLVVDVKSSVGLGPAVPVVQKYGNHPITKGFGKGMSFYRLARAIETTPVAGVQSTNLLLTKSYPDSWAESDQKSEKLEFNQGSDLPGPLALGVALTRKATSTAASNTATPTKAIPTITVTGTKSSTTPPAPPARPIAKESRLVVIGNSDFATDGLFDQQLNGDVFLNSVTWLSQQDNQPLLIRPKQVKNRRINLTPAQGQLLSWTSVLVLPILGFLSAGVLWWQRR